MWFKHGGEGFPVKKRKGFVAQFKDESKIRRVHEAQQHIRLNNPDITLTDRLTLRFV